MYKGNEHFFRFIRILERKKVDCCVDGGEEANKKLGNCSKMYTKVPMVAMCQNKMLEQ